MPKSDDEGLLAKGTAKAVSTTGAIAGVAVGVMMLNIVADSTLRAFFNRPIPGTFDYSQFWWMITIGFAGLGLAQKRNEHIEATVLFDLLPDRLKPLWTATASAITAVLLAALIWFGWTSAQTNRIRGEYSGGSGVSIWPARYWVPVGAALFLLQALVMLRASRERQSAGSSPERSAP